MDHKTSPRPSSQGRLVETIRRALIRTHIRPGHALSGLALAAILDIFAASHPIYYLVLFGLPPALSVIAVRQATYATTAKMRSHKLAAHTHSLENYSFVVGMIVGWILQSIQG
ncbi:hypothetical protein FJY94_00195 [Candidatus Kaiserbacteria bacterium]|nr:hypothetical protein [Candidatus Kaiserbacteria bacterium]